MIKEKLQKLDEISLRFEKNIIKTIFNITIFVIVIYGLRIILAKNELKNHKNEAVCFTLFQETFLETIICTKKVLKLWCF